MKNKLSGALLVTVPLALFSSSDKPAENRSLNVLYTQRAVLIEKTRVDKTAVTDMPPRQSIVTLIKAYSILSQRNDDSMMNTEKEVSNAKKHWGSQCISHRGWEEYRAIET